MTDLLPTLANILYSVNQRARYQHEPDGKDVWQTPAETYRLGTGDCEDFAAAYWFEVLDYATTSNPRIAWMMLRDVKEPHMVCLVGDGDPWVLDVLADAPYRLSERDDVLSIWAIGDPPTKAAGVAFAVSAKWIDVLTRIVREQLVAQA